MTQDSRGSGGRPSIYTQETADAICEHIAHGKSLVSYCSQDGAPGYSTVMRWLEANESFRDNYARARVAQADFLAEEILQIADDGSNDTYQTDNGPAVNQDVIARSRLRVDSRKWYAGRMAPKKYGDKVQLDADVKVEGQLEHTHRVSDATARLLDEVSRAGADRSSEAPVQN